MKEITRCVVGFRKRYNFEVRWLLSQVVTKQINDLLFSWFRIGKHRVPEAGIVVGAVAELTSTEQRAAASLLLGSKAKYQQAASTCLLPSMLARGPVINMPVHNAHSALAQCTQCAFVRESSEEASYRYGLCTVWTDHIHHTLLLVYNPHVITSRTCKLLSAGGNPKAKWNILSVNVRLTSIQF